MKFNIIKEVPHFNAKRHKWGTCVVIAARCVEQAAKQFINIYFDSYFETVVLRKSDITYYKI